MSWIGVGVAAVGAISGAQTAQANRKRQAKHDAFRKKAIEFSPWTNMGDPGQGNFGNQDTFSGMLGGAAQGYALGSGIGGAFGGGAAGAAGAGGAGAMGKAGQGALGSGQMTAELGKMGSNVGQMQAGLGSAGGGPWGQMAGSAGSMGSASQMQMPQLGSGMMGLNQQAQGLNPMSQFNKPAYTLGMNYGN